jgi:hypothetical protein
MSSLYLYRMHRTLKEDTAKPPARTVTAQQKKFDRFRLVFNRERPHEALGNDTPGSIYVPGTRLFPGSVASFQYPKSFQTRRVNNSGDISGTRAGSWSVKCSVTKRSA